MRSFMGKIALCGALLFGAAAFSFSSVALGAEVTEAVGQEAAVAGEDSDMKGYLYASKVYDYAIVCLTKPEVIPASVLYEDGKYRGEVLLFDYTQGINGFEINHGWVILKDGFSDEEVPDLNKLSETEIKALEKKFLTDNVYGEAMVTNISEDNKGLVLITAKQLDLDAEGNGQYETVEVADQRAVTYFRTPKGTRYKITLIERPEINEADMQAYRVGVSMFKEVERKGNEK